MQSLSLNQLTTFRWTFEEDIHFARLAGFDAVGVWRRKLDDFGIDRAAELLADAGLGVSCLSWAGGFTGGDGRSLDESIRDGMAAVGMAQRLKAGCLVVMAGGRNNHIDRHRDRLLSHALDDLLMVAEVAGVTLALKPMHATCADEWTFQNSLVETLDLVRRYKSPHLKLVYDHYHFPELVDSPALLRELAPHLALVQLADAKLPHSIEQERCPLDAGVLPVWRTAAALREAGYQGPFDVELMGSEIEMLDCEQLVFDTFAALDRGIHGRVGEVCKLPRRQMSAASSS